MDILLIPTEERGKKVLIGGAENNDISCYIYWYLITFVAETKQINVKKKTINLLHIHVL
jgi:hypothetical protein